MTLEQIEMQMWINYDEGYKAGCSETINKACEFFNKRMYELDSKHHDTYVMDKFSSSIKDFIKDFKEYMEEQQ